MELPEAIGTEKYEEMSAHSGSPRGSRGDFVHTIPEHTHSSNPSPHAKGLNPQLLQPTKDGRCATPADWISAANPPK